MWITIAFVVAFASFLVWALTATMVSITLRDTSPELYAKAGSPRPAEFWGSRAWPNSFDEFTLTRQFRKLHIGNRDVVWQLELACWLRWLQITSLCAFVVLLFASMA